MHRRVEKEKRIVETMIKKYCLEVHHDKELCPDCSDLIKYAEKRLLSCPFIEDKPVCSKCDIHCYNKIEQSKIKEVMRIIGPKMIYTNTLDTLWYLWYKFRHKYQKIT